MNPTLHTAAVAALEHLINQALQQQSPAVATALEQLEGRVFQLELKNAGISLFLLPAGDGINLRGFLDGAVDTHICGSIADFVELISSKDTTSTLINGGISIRGDSAPLLQLVGVLQTLDLDWEASLAGLIGDIPAHQLGQAVRGGVKWGRHTLDSAGRQLEEYLHEEARLLPPDAELQNFFSDIHQLDLCVDRVEARLKRQQARIDKLVRQP